MEPDQMGEPAGSQSLPTTDREAKRQRLRKLEESPDSSDYVTAIVKHMERYYRAAKPPAWLDLRDVARQLSRTSPIPKTRRSRHMAWSNFRKVLDKLRTWMGDHETWTDALKANGQKPHLGTPSEVKALEFLTGRSGPMHERLDRLLKEVRLNFLLEDEPISENEMPDFWKGANFGCPVWRSKNMQPRGHTPKLPFQDDLTDLVLSTICQQDQLDNPGILPTLRPQEAHQSAPPLPEVLQQEAQHEVQPEPQKEPQKEACQSTTPGDIPVKDEGKSECPKVGGEGIRANASDSNQSDGTDASRIAHEVFSKIEALAAAVQSGLLGKRSGQDIDNVNDETPAKRQKTAEEIQPTTTVVSGDDTGRPDPNKSKPASDHQRLLAKIPRLAKDVKTLTETYKELHQKHGKEYKDLRAKYRELEAQNKASEEHQTQTNVWCEALTNDLRQLEKQGAQATAQCSALEEENKGFRSQMVALTTRVDALDNLKLEEENKALRSLVTALEGKLEEEGKTRGSLVVNLEAKLEEEKKAFRSQMADLEAKLEEEKKARGSLVAEFTARIEALEKPKLKSEPEIAQASTCHSGDRGRPAAENDHLRPEQPVAQEQPGPQSYGTCSHTHRHPHAGGHHQPSIWHSQPPVKCECTSRPSVVQKQRSYYKPISERFPRVPEPPTFPPSWDPEEAVFGRQWQGYEGPSRPLLRYQGATGTYYPPAPSHAYRTEATLHVFPPPKAHQAAHEVTPNHHALPSVEAVQPSQVREEQQEPPRKDEERCRSLSPPRDRGAC
ncbi:hypothetical protein VTJ49DRAFT_5355 [Mycothermus thermophilus]|uniref:Uncharacterized protein n=1 Tax=Humicola insolens TaxID=85995 RepID=A0ABR3VLN4_HUMIN